MVSGVTVELMAVTSGVTMELMAVASGVALELMAVAYCLLFLSCGRIKRSFVNFQ